ncbi:MAG: histidinol-phosphatase HisJ family protein [Eubacteriales bacterium]
MKEKFKADYHTHSKYSFDGCESIRVMARAAEAAGLCEIAVTDHCDIDGVLAGFYPSYDGDAIEKEINEVRSEFDGRLTILHGIELGQPHTRPAQSRELIERYKYDFVIGSLHNMRDMPDFSFLRYDKMGYPLSENYFSRSLCELCELCDFGGIHTLAHITYPVRYMREYGMDIDYRKFYDQFELLYKKMIACGVALEINTSGLRRAAHATLPDTELVALYRECGGKLVTVGSDAHIAGDIGAGIEESYETMKKLGFKSVNVIRGGKLDEISL